MDREREREGADGGWWSQCEGGQRCVTNQAQRKFLHSIDTEGNEVRCDVCVHVCERERERERVVGVF